MSSFLRMLCVSAATAVVPVSTEDAISQGPQQPEANLHTSGVHIPAGLDHPCQHHIRLQGH